MGDFMQRGGTTLDWHQADNVVAADQAHLTRRPTDDLREMGRQLQDYMHEKWPEAFVAANAQNPEYLDTHANTIRAITEGRSTRRLKKAYKHDKGWTKVQTTAYFDKARKLALQWVRNVKAQGTDNNPSDPSAPMTTIPFGSRLSWEDQDRIARVGYAKMRTIHTTPEDPPTDPLWEDTTDTQRDAWRELVGYIDRDEPLDDFIQGYKNKGFPTAGEKIVEMFRDAYLADRLERLRPLAIPKGMQEAVQGGLPRVDLPTLNAAQAAHRAFITRVGGKPLAWDQTSPETRKMCLELAQAVRVSDLRWLKEAWDSCEGDEKSQGDLQALEDAIRSSLGIPKPSVKEVDEEITEIEKQAELTVRAEHLAKVGLKYAATHVLGGPQRSNITDQTKSAYHKLALMILKGDVEGVARLSEILLEDYGDARHVGIASVQTMEKEAQRRGWLEGHPQDEKGAAQTAHGQPPGPPPPPKPEDPIAKLRRMAKRRRGESRISTTGKLLIEMARVVDWGDASPHQNDTFGDGIARWEDAGCPAYVITDDVAEALEATDAPLSSRLVDLPWPSTAFYVEMESHAFYSDAVAYHGVLLSTEVNVGATPKKTEYKGLGVTAIGYDMEGHLVRWLYGLGPWDASIQTGLASHQGSLEPWMEDLVAFAVNVVLFLAHDPRAAKLVPEEQTNAYARASQKGNPKKRKKLERAAERLSGYSRYVVHLDGKTKAALGFGDGGSRDYHGVRLHAVRGHWRNQAHGPKRALRKAMWIKPHYRGDAALGVIDKIYSDSPKKAKRALESRTPKGDGNSNGMSGV